MEPRVDTGTALRFSNASGFIMKNVFRLLLVVGLLAAGWLNRDKLRGLRGGPTTLKDAEGEPPTTEVERSAAATPPPTPHPARDAQIAAAKAYPALGIPDSALNKKFRALYAQAQVSEPALLARPDWPLKLAERAAIALGGGPMPVPTTPAPSKPFTPLRNGLDMAPGTQLVK